MTQGAKRTRKRASISAANENIRPGAGDDLLVGWRSEPRKQRVGFTCDVAPIEADDQGDPIWMKGEGHLITIAPTGKGKGRGALIPNLLTYEGPAIVIDPKGEAYSVTARRRREMGQEIRVIDPFGVVTQNTDSLNPMDVFDLPDADPSALAMEVAKQLSGGGQSLQDPFWDIRGHDLVAGVISAVASTAEPHERNLNKVRKYLKADDVVYGLAVLLDTVGGKLHRFAYEEISSFLQIDDRCRSGILATGASYLSIIGADSAQRTVMNSTIDLKAVTRGDPMTIYLVVPPNKLKSHGSLFRLWVSALMSAVLSRNSAMPKYRTLFAIDECAQLGDFEMLSMVYTLARSYGVRVWAFFQDLAQVKKMLPRDWQTVLTNTAAIQVFGVSNHLMASDLAPVLGDFSDQTLRTMGDELVALQLAGAHGVVARKPDYLCDDIYKGLYDPHPIMGKRPLKKSDEGRD